MNTHSCRYENHGRSSWPHGSDRHHCLLIAPVMYKPYTSTQTCQVSCIRRETHTFEVYLMLSHIHTTLELSLLLQTKVTKNCYHQMHFLGSNVTEMQLWLGLRLRPRWDSLQHFPRPLSWLWGDHL